MTTHSVVGRSVTRADGPDIVSGATRYPADIVLPGMLVGKTLRSDLPHARIKSIDTSRAARLPGVRAILTGKDLRGMRVGRFVRDVPLLAEDKVRFVGEKVAAVAADSIDIAEEALMLIDVEYDELPAVFDPLEAMAPGSPLVHEGSGPYESRQGSVQPEGNVVHHETWSQGDVEQGFRESDVIVEHTVTTPWVHQGYLEPYTCVVEIDDAGHTQIWANNKSPFLLRWQMATAVGLPETRITANPCGIGGDFGGKAGAMDVPLAYFLSVRTGRPVKMIMDFIEELTAGNPRHPSVITIKTGVKNDGRFWARRARVVYNGGAYAGFRGNIGLKGGRQAGGGPYYIPNVQIDSYIVYTNNVPCGSYRAPGEPQAVFAVESHTDMLAQELGRDPYELRRQNLVHETDTSATGEHFNHVRAEETLDAAANAANWGSPKKRANVGRGIAIGQRPPAASTSVALVSLDEDARATLHTPVPETGVGAHTVGRQIVAEVLGIEVEHVGVIQLDTDAVLFDTGAGAATSRVAGHATLGAAQEVRTTLTRLAAQYYGWPAEQIILREGRVFVEGGAERSVPMRELAAKAVAASGGPISGEMTYKATPAEVTSYCAQVAEVEVDVETGQIKVVKFITAHDVGTILNPLGHQGQIDGAVIQGLGYALIEGLQSDEGRISTVTQGEARIPVTGDIPQLETLLLQTTVGLGPYQGKGIGENPISPVAPAIANAVYDAVGVRIQGLPITAEKVLSKLRLGK